MFKSDFELLEKVGQTGYLYIFGGKSIQYMKCVYYTNRQLVALREGQPMPYTLFTAKDKHCWEGREPDTLFYRSDDPEGIKYFRHPEDDDVWFGTLKKEDDPLNGWAEGASLRGHLYLDRVFFKRGILPLCFFFERNDEKACELFRDWAEQKRKDALSEVGMYSNWLEAITVENITNE